MMNGAQGRMVAIVLGVLLIVVGYVLWEVVIDQAATATANANIGSFSGAAAIGRLGPTVFAMSLVIIGIGLMAIGATGFAGRGPLGVFAPVAFGILTPAPVLATALAIAVVATIYAYRAGALVSCATAERVSPWVQPNFA